MIPNTDPPQYKTYNDLTLTRDGNGKDHISAEYLEFFKNYFNLFREFDDKCDRILLLEHFYKINCTTLLMSILFCFFSSTQTE